MIGVDLTQEISKGMCLACQVSNHDEHVGRQRGHYQDETTNLKREDRVENNTIVRGKSCVCKGNCNETRNRLTIELIAPPELDKQKGLFVK